MSTKDHIAWADYGRHHLRNGTPYTPPTLMYPERNTGDLWKPGRVAAEVRRALSKPIPEHPKPEPVLPIPEPRPMSYAQAAKIVGISPAGMLQRVRKHGWRIAMAMGSRKDRAA